MNDEVARPDIHCRKEGAATGEHTGMIDTSQTFTFTVTGCLDFTVATS